MVDEQEPTKRVVKRVVKKTVARPSTPPAPAEPPTAMRYGRPVATPSRPTPRASVATATKPVTKTSTPKAPRQRPSIDVGARVATVRENAERLWWAVADTTVDGARATGRFATARARSVAAWRLPHLNGYLASAITGAVTGLVAVLLGVSALALFESIRGVSSGGGFWGGLTFTAVSVISIMLGTALMRGFGATGPGLTSVLAVVLTITAMLGLFLDAVDGTLGLVLVPLLGVVTYVVAHWLVDLAENAPPVID